jgi:hypothetical protein
MQHLLPRATQTFQVLKKSILRSEQLLERVHSDVMTPFIEEYCAENILSPFQREDVQKGLRKALSTVKFSEIHWIRNLPRGTGLIDQKLCSVFIYVDEILIVSRTKQDVREILKRIEV